MYNANIRKYRYGWPVFFLTPPFYHICSLPLKLDILCFVDSLLLYYALFLMTHFGFCRTIWRPNSWLCTFILSNWYISSPSYPRSARNSFWISTSKQLITWYLSSTLYSVIEFTAMNPLSFTTICIFFHVLRLYRFSCLFSNYSLPV